MTNITKILQEFDKKFIDEEELDGGLGTSGYLNDEANEIEPLRAFIKKALLSIKKETEKEILDIVNKELKGVLHYDSIEDIFQKEAHPTKDDYCCACEWDILVMEDKIKEAKEKLIKEIRKKKMDDTKDHTGACKEMACHVCNFIEGYNKSLEDYKNLIKKL